MMYIEWAAAVCYAEARENHFVADGQVSGYRDGMHLLTFQPLSELRNVVSRYKNIREISNSYELI